MISKTVRYEDFDGKTVEEKFFFHMSAPEMVRLDAKYDGGLEKELDRLSSTNNNLGLMSLFEEMIRISYGVVEEVNGKKRFVKNHEEAESFMNSLAYEQLFIELISSEEAATNFFNALSPSIKNGGQPPARRG